MFKKMKHMKNEKGLTLIELLAVIVILAIIAAIAIPAIGNIINNQKDKATLSDISGAISAAKIAYAEGSCSAGAGTAAEPTKSVCDEDDIAFDSDKVTAIDVKFDNDGKATVTGITVTEAFKGKKKATYDALIAKTTGTGTGFAESELNEAMGN